MGSKTGPQNSLTLKHTHSEKGSVIMTMTQDIPVRSQPQIPMPTSTSSAEKERERIRRLRHGKNSLGLFSPVLVPDRTIPPLLLLSDVVLNTV